MAGSHQFGIQGAQNVEGRVETLPASCHEMKAADHGPDRPRTVKPAHLIQGIDQAGMGAADADHQSVPGVDPQGQVVNDGVWIPSQGIEEKRPSGVLVSCAPIDGAGQSDTFGKLHGFRYPNVSD